MLIVLAAGAGSRMCTDIPKPLLRVSANETILYRIVRQFSLPTVIVVGYKAETIMQHMWDLATFAFNPMWRSTGPAGSLMCAANLFEGEAIVAYGDTVFDDWGVNEIKERYDTAAVVHRVDTGVPLSYRDGKICRVDHSDTRFAGMLHVHNLGKLLESATNEMALGHLLDGMYSFTVPSVNVNTKDDFVEAREWVARLRS